MEANEVIDDLLDDEPTMEDALTLNDLIATLEGHRRKWGGDTPVVMADFEPVVRAGVVHVLEPEELVRRVKAGEDSQAKEGEGVPYVIITDRF
jgi:hypothetical protein